MGDPLLGSPGEAGRLFASTRIPYGAILFYDAHCPFCRRSVVWLSRRDHAHRLAFAPLGGATFRQRVAEQARQNLPDSAVFLGPDGRLMIRSAAVLGALALLGPGWRLLAGCARILPRGMADAAYDAIARRRGCTGRGPCPAPSAAAVHPTDDRWLP